MGRHHIARPPRRRRPNIWHALRWRYRGATATLGGTLAVVPATVAVIAAGGWAGGQPVPDAPGVTRVLGLEGGVDTGLAPVAVNGSLPDAAQPAALPAPLSSGQPPTTARLSVGSLGPGGALGIPGSALQAYRKAAERMAAEQPGCGIDWALIASIGRIESNHARGGYVDANGTTREPILGPVLNGIGPVAAIRDTDNGRHDGDTTWDRAVGPTQFIPSTWIHYAADGNNDGTADPNNIYDAALATARYLCSGGFDLTDPEQLRAAVYRYNHSDTYVNTVILWATAYRGGVTPTPDSTVPTGTTHNTTTTGAPNPTTPPPHQTTPGNRPDKPSTPDTPTGTPTPAPPPTTAPSTPSEPEPSEPEPTEPSEPEPTEPPASSPPPESSPTASPTAEPTGTPTTEPSSPGTSSAAPVA